MNRDELVRGDVQSGGRAPAEGDLRLVQDFVNTVDRENGVELFDGPEGLAAWLDHRGLPGAGEGVERALEVREALRALLLANNGGTPAPDDSRVLEEAGRRARLYASFGEP